MDLFILTLPSRETARQSLTTYHGRMMALSLIVVCAYLPVWLGMVGGELLKGSSYSFINLGFLYLGFRDVLRYSKRANKSSPSPSERWIGYAFILGSLILFFPLRSSISFQALMFSGTVFGGLLAQWGFFFLNRYKLTILLAFMSFYPDFSYLTYTIRLALTGSALEQLMAYSSSIVFQVLGQASYADGTLLFLADGAVEVAPGCSGADMAFPIAGIAMILGLLFEQSPKKIVALVATGVVLALVFNIPRVMLLTIAIVHWGQESFDFWHGPWGGQIFSGVLFTVYYYLFMWISGVDAEKASS